MKNPLLSTIDLPRRSRIDFDRGLFLLILVGVICGTLYGTDFLRVQGPLQALDVFLLRPFRGVFYLSQGWPLLGFLCLVIVVIASTGQYQGRAIEVLRLTSPVVMLLAYITIAAFFSPFPDAVEWRLRIFRDYVAPLLIAGVLLGGARGVVALRNGFLVFGVLLLIIAALKETGLSPVDLTETQDLGEARLIMESDYITTAQLCFASSLASFFAAWRATSPKFRIALCSLGAALILVGLQTGARGPLLGFIAAAIAVVLIAPSTWKKRVCLALPLAVVSVLITVRLASLVRDQALEHLISAPDEVRSFYFSQAALVGSSLLGRGFGAGSMIGVGNDDYVHNLFLEMYFENGVAGTGILLVVLGACFLRLWREWQITRGHDPLFLIALLIFYLACGQFSGTLLGMRGLWFVMAVGCTSVTARTIPQVRHNNQWSQGGERGRVRKVGAFDTGRTA